MGGAASCGATGDSRGGGAGVYPDNCLLCVQVSSAMLYVRCTHCISICICCHTGVTML